MLWEGQPWVGRAGGTESAAARGGIRCEHEALRVQFSMFSVPQLNPPRGSLCDATFTTRCEVGTSLSLSLIHI